MAIFVIYFSDIFFIPTHLEMAREQRGVTKDDDERPADVFRPENVPGARTYVHERKERGIAQMKPAGRQTQTS